MKVKVTIMDKETNKAAEQTTNESSEQETIRYSQAYIEKVKVDQETNLSREQEVEDQNFTNTSESEDLQRKFQEALQQGIVKTRVVGGEIVGSTEPKVVEATATGGIRLGAL